VPQQHRSPVGTAAKKKTFCAYQSSLVPRHTAAPEAANATS
jgi:hypothetical protein